MANPAAGDFGCNIKRSGASGNYTYSVASGYANRPVNYVSWYSALRFVNWLTNGQGNGDTESGSYTITGAFPATVSIPTHTSGSTPKWFLTSENEWYKAAYYKNGVYSLYANGTNTAPVAGALCNYDHYDYTSHLTWDGSLNGETEQNGTKDMMGNVVEWNESLINGLHPGLRGGSFDNNIYSLQASGRESPLQTWNSNYNVGFRVSYVVPVPEPSPFIALAGGLISLFSLRRRRIS